MVIFSPIAYPLSWMVQRLLGAHQGVTYKRNELKELVQLLTGNQLTKDEVRIITGVLELVDRRPDQIMVPLEHVFMLEADAQVTLALLNQIRERGYSRIPVYDGSPQNITAILLTKTLATHESSFIGRRIRDIAANLAPKHVSVSASLFTILSDMRSGQRNTRHILR
jgi:metal transporter CNNM